MKNISLRSLSHKELHSYGIGFVFLFILMPILLQAFPECTREYTARWLIFAVTPIALVGGGIVLGLTRGACFAYALMTLVLSFPQGWLLRLESVWQYAIGYALLAISANLATDLLQTTQPKK